MERVVQRRRESERRGREISTLNRSWARGVRRAQPLFAQHMPTTATTVQGGSGGGGWVGEREFDSHDVGPEARCPQRGTDGGAHGGDGCFVHDVDDAARAACLEPFIRVPKVVQPCAVKVKDND